MKSGYLVRSVLAFAVSAFVLSSLAFAEPGANFRAKSKGEERHARMCKELGLSEEQSRQMKESFEQSKAKKTELYTVYKEKKTLLRTQLEAKDLDRAAVDRTVKELKEIQGQMLDDKVSSLLKTRSILTPEQFEKLNAMHQKGGKCGGGFKKGWMGKHGGKGPCGF
jgi:Spy/CpxP family protein refolding chaperone